jgi:hypothetical protein
MHTRYMMKCLNQYLCASASHRARLSLYKKTLKIIHGVEKRLEFGVWINGSLPRQFPSQCVVIAT